MNKNTSRIIKLTIILFIFLILVVFKEHLTNFFSPKSTTPFQSLKKDQISSIELVSNTKKQELNKKGGKWLVINNKTDWKADEERINSLMDAALKINKDEIASTNKNKHKDFGIDKEKIILFTKDKKYSIYIGKTVDFDKNYLRLENDSEVLIAAGLNNVFLPEDYRDLAVHFVSDESKLTKIEIEFERKKTALEKKGNNWKIGGKTAKKDRVDFFLNDLKTLKGNDVLPKDTTLPESITLYIKIIEGKKEKTISFYPKDEQNYLAKFSNSELIFQIPTAYVESLKKVEKDFVE